MGVMKMTGNELKRRHDPDSQQEHRPDEARRYALLGRGISHSYSKLIHRIFADSRHFDNYEYDMIEVASAGELGRYLDDREYSGFNVTMPYKRDVIEHLADLSYEAMDIDAVNTIERNHCGRLIGYNTDSFGAKLMLGRERIEGRRCLVLGTGGASDAVCHALRELGAAEVIIASRKAERGVTYDAIGSGAAADALSCEVIVNTTPVGMFPNIEAEPPVDVTAFPKLKFAADVIYNPYRTRFLQAAEDVGAEVCSGLDMLIGQGLRAAEIWRGKKLTDKWRRELIDRAAGEILAKELNIVFIGMPGSGKTTISRRLASITGREFFDTDGITEKILGTGIAEDIAQNGEAHFRAAETEAVRRACAGRGAVIATGGGSILSEANRRNLRANSVVVYIRRPLADLAKKNRPLTASSGVEKLYRERSEIYERMADVTVDNSSRFGGSKGRGGRRNSYNHDMNRFAAGIIEAISRECGVNFGRDANRK